MSTPKKNPPSVNTSQDPGLEYLNQREIEIAITPVENTTKDFVFEEVTQVITNVFQVNGPSGANGQLQFNQNGQYIGDAELQYDPNTDTLTTGSIIANSIRITGNASSFKLNGGYNNEVLKTDGNGNLSWANVFPSVSGNTGKFLVTNGVSIDWSTTDYNSLATTTYVTSAIANLAGTAPAMLDTLGEIANIIGQTNDPQFGIISQLANKANISSLSQVAFSGSYTDLSNRPNISTVGSTGNYSDLNGKPTIPATIRDLGISEGTNGQILTTDGNGNYSFTTVTSGSNANIGNIKFANNIIYSNTGVVINNSDLNNGQTAGMAIPVQGDGNTAALYNTYGNVTILTGNIGNSQPVQAWTFNPAGALFFPQTPNVTSAILVNDNDQELSVSTDRGNISIWPESSKWLFGADGKLTLPAPLATLTNVSQLATDTAKIYRATNSTDLEAIADAKDTWTNAEGVWTDIVNQDFQLSGYTWPWTGKPSWEGYPLLMNYNSSGTPGPGVPTPSSSLAPAGNSAMQAYLAYKQLLSSIDIVSGNKTFSFENTGALRVPGVITKDNSLMLVSSGVNGILPNGNSAAVNPDGQYGRVLIRTDDGTTLRTWTFDVNGNLILPSGGDIKNSAGASVLGGGTANTGDIVFNGSNMTGSDNAIRMRTLNVSQTASYNFTPGNSDYSTAVWNGTSITFNNPTQAIYDAIWALTDVSVIEVQIGSTWFTVTSAGSSTPGMPQAPTLFVNETAVGGPLNIDVVDITINQGTESYAEIDSTDFRVDVQDDIRMYANDVFRLTNRSSNDPIQIETNDGDYTWEFDASGNLILPSGGDIIRDGTSVLGTNTLDSVTDNGSTTTNSITVGSVSLTNGSAITETVTTTVITPPTALTGQSLVIRPTGATGIISDHPGGFADGDTITLTVTPDYNYNTVTGTVDYTFTGCTQVQLGRALTGTLTFTNETAKPISWTIPVSSTMTTFTITLSNAVGFDISTIAPLTLSTTGSSEDHHIHLIAGDPTTTDIYLGDDDQYVKIEKNGGNVVIGTDTNSRQWTFDFNGTTTFPGNLVIAGNTSVFGTNRALIQPADDLPLVVLSSGANGAVSSIWVEDIANVGTSNIAAVYANPVPGSGIVRIVVGQNGVGSGPNLWDFNATGNLTLPTGGNLIVSGSIVGGGASPAPTLSGFSSVSALEFKNGTSNVTINSNSNLWKFGTDGNLTIPGSSGGFIKTVSNASIGIAAVDNGTDNPAQLLSINAGSGAATSIVSAYATNATIQTNATGAINTWKFDNAGNLTLPANTFAINYANGTQVSLGSGSSSNISNGNSNVSIATSAGNVVTHVNGSAILTTYSGGIKVGGSGILQSPGGAGSITLNNNGANIPTANITTQLNVTGASGANILGTANTGIGALNVGVTTTPLANTVASFNSNVNYYTQVTLQNKSTGTDATADFVITADNGSDTVNYADFGIINSGYDANTPTNSLGNIVFAADTYLYAQGNTSNASQSGGNLAIGTTVPGKNVKIFAGGITNASIIANIANTGVTVNGNVTVSGGSFVGNGAGLTNVTVNAAGNIQGTSSNVSLVAGSYTMTFDNTGILTLPRMGGDEGGEINFGIPASNTTLTTRVAVDIYQDRFRIFDGSTKGVYIDLSQASSGVGTLLNNRVSAFVNAGTFVTMDNIKATVTTTGSRGLSLATVSGSYTYSIGGTYGTAAPSSGGSAGTGTLTTTATASIFNWAFTSTGDTSTYIVTNTSSLLAYRITLLIGASFNNNMISIERLI